MTKREQRATRIANAVRRLQIIRELTELSRNGWANAKRYDWQPLERELALLDKDKDK